MGEVVEEVRVLCVILVSFSRLIGDTVGVRRVVFFRRYVYRFIRRVVMMVWVIGR